MQCLLLSPSPLAAVIAKKIENISPPIARNLSGQYASTGNMREDGVMYIKFNADLPDERDIKYNEDKSIGTGTSTMTIIVGGKTARLTFAFEITDNSNGEEMYGGNAIHVIGAQLGNKTVANEENGDMVIVLVVDEGGLILSDEVPIPEEATATNLMADAPLANKVYLGSGYDVTGAYLSNDCLRENVIDLSTFDESDQPKIAAFSGTGSLVSGVDNAWGFLNGLRVARTGRCLFRRHVYGQSTIQGSIGAWR